MKIAVVYKSKYGSTKSYAQWIAEELACPLFEVSSIAMDKLLEYDLLIYGGGVYAGSLSGIKIISKKFQGKLVVFAVGLSGQNDEASVNKFAKKNGIPGIKLFLFQGGYVFDKLSPLHRFIMGSVRKLMSLKPGMSPEQKASLNSNTLDFKNRESIEPLVRSVKEILQ